MLLCRVNRSCFAAVAAGYVVNHAASALRCEGGLRGPISLSKTAVLPPVQHHCERFFNRLGGVVQEPGILRGPKGTLRDMSAHRAKSSPRKEMGV